MIQSCGYDELTRRWTELLVVRDFASMLSLERARPRTFIALVIADSTTASDATLHRFASLLLRAGAVHVSAVGGAAARLGRIFEDVVLMSETCSDEAHVILTESHDEDIVGALEFVLCEARPSAAYIEACGSTLVILISDACDEVWLRTQLSDPDEFRARLLMPVPSE